MKGYLKRSRMAQISASQHLPVRSCECAKTKRIVHGFQPKTDRMDHLNKDCCMMTHLVHPQVWLLSLRRCSESYA